MLESISDRLLHVADSALTLHVYAHAMRKEESDVSFADFAGQGGAEVAAEDGSERLYPAPASDEADEELAKSAETMARREGLSVPLRGPGVPAGSENLDVHCSYVSW